jgi:hypothetical protein
MAFDAVDRRSTRVRDHAPSKPESDGGSLRSALGMGLIGLDVAGHRSEINPRRVLPILIVVVIVALAVTSLRIEILRQRYALAESTLEEQRLLDAERTLTAAHRKLRDPVHLARLAKEQGFVAPDSQGTLAALPAHGPASVLAAIGDGVAPRSVRP